MKSFFSSAGFIPAHPSAIVALTPVIDAEA
jgi:hypothetical protein